MDHTSNPGIQEVETGGLEVQDHPQMESSPSFLQLCLNITKQKDR